MLNSTLALSTLYLVPVSALMLWHHRRRRRLERRGARAWQESQVAGLREPESLHPVIDPARCAGCGTCVAACPEGEILGLVGGRAELVEPTACIGHGACAEACPTGAITLVFGTRTRGLELPRVGPDFQTDVPGLYIAGELGGMGLIRNAVEQGCQAVASIARARRSAAPGSGSLDLLIIGAGPAGFAASLAAQQAGMNFETIEQESLGGTVAHFPRGKLVMTAPMELPLYGKIRVREISKEDLLGLWAEIERHAGLRIRYDERMERIERTPTGFVVHTSRGSHPAQSVLLAIGRRGTPRRLEVPGEDLPKVVYRLDDPAQYAGRSVVVAGGGDSALEAALAVAEQSEARVTLAYRGDAFTRAKPKNRHRLEDAAGAGRIDLALRTHLRQITPDSVHLENPQGPHVLANDAVMVCAGGVLPTGLLQEIGVRTVKKYGEP